MKLLLEKQLLNNVAFQSTKYRKKKLGVDNKVQEFFDQTQSPAPKKDNRAQIWNKRIRFLFDDDFSNIFNFQTIYSFSIYCQPVKFNQLSINLQKIVIFSASNDGVQWTLDFGADSVTITVKVLDQNITTSSQEKTRAAWHLVSSQRQDFFNNHLAPVPTSIQNQEGTMR